MRLSFKEPLPCMLKLQVVCDILSKLQDIYCPDLFLQSDEGFVLPKFRSFEKNVYTLNSLKNKLNHRQKINICINKDIVVNFLRKRFHKGLHFAKDCDSFNMTKNCFLHKIYNRIDCHGNKYGQRVWYVHNNQIWISGHHFTVLEKTVSKRRLMRNLRWQIWSDTPLRMEYIHMLLCRAPVKYLPHMDCWYSETCL